MEDKPARKVELSDLEAGSIRHSTLPPTLFTRIENIARVFAEVDSQPVKDWVKDFQRDGNPEKEVAIWEILAGVYATFTKDRKLTVEAKKEAFNLLLLRSMNGKRAALKQVNLRSLSRGEARLLLHSYENVASAKGWGFR